MTISFLAGLMALQAPPSGWIEIVEPSPPSSVAIVLTATCRQSSIALHYRLNRPGLDGFTAISIDGAALSGTEIGRINEMLAGYMMEDVAVESCTGAGAGYDVRVRLEFGRGGERQSTLLGISGGRVRTVR